MLPTYLLDAPTHARSRHPWRAAATVTAVALAVGVLIAAIAGFGDALDWIDDRGRRPRHEAPFATPTTMTPTTVAPQNPAVVSAVASVLAAHHDAGDFVGARVSLLDADGSLTEVTSGSDRTGPDGKAVSLEEAWNIGSATKTFVAVVVLQLADEGFIDLDRGIERWMPSLRDADRITPRMLLQHTSGLNEYLDQPAVQADKQRPWTPTELVAVAEAAGRVGEPGGPHHYTNTNYIVLGELIEAVTGETWDRQVRSRITEPLGMDHTDVVGHRIAPVGYRVVDGKFVDATQSADPSIGGAAGGLASTGADLLRFAEALAKGKLLSPSTKRAMESFIPAEDLSRFGVDHGYGLGIERHATADLALIGHMGTGEAQSAYFGFDPTHGRAIAVTTNTAVPGPAAMIAMESLLAVAPLSG